MLAASALVLLCSLAVVAVRVKVTRHTVVLCDDKKLVIAVDTGRARGAADAV